MFCAILLNTFWLLLPMSIADKEIVWYKSEVKKTVNAVVLNCFGSSCNQWYYPLYHHKTHFGLIIKQGTIFSLTIKASEEIENLKFFCFSQSPRGSFNTIDLEGVKGNKQYKVSANFNCIPMLSDSYNIPVEVTIRTHNWTNLPIFVTRDTTLSASQEAETRFYKSLKIYGFVENYYTQMILSRAEIEAIRGANCSLYIGLQNQADVVKYYDSLFSVQRNGYSCNTKKIHFTERTVLFLSLSPCHETFVAKMPNFQSNLLCSNLDVSCNYTEEECNLAYLSDERIGFESILEWMLPAGNTSWMLLHEFGHYYDIENYLLGFGYTGEVWNNIFAALYQQKFKVDEYWMSNSTLEPEDTVRKYQQGVPVDSWNNKEKLHFFMSLFGYDGTDALFREFHVRHFQADKSSECDSANIVPVIVEIFLDFHNVNILPYLKRVIDFENYSLPVINPDLELRALNGLPIMPAVDFNVSASDVERMSMERDFRQVSPLILLTAVKKKYVRVNFVITPFDLSGTCLYVNNDCHIIHAKSIQLDLQANVYSVYIATRKGKKLYLSGVTYHVIAKESRKEIRIEVKEVDEKETLPLVYYIVDAAGFGDKTFLRMFVNYEDMTISLSQISNDIHEYFTETYFSVKLERNASNIFDYQFLGTKDDRFENSELLNVRHKFQVDDKLHIFHAEPERLFVNNESLGKITGSSNFILTDKGLVGTEDKNLFIKANTVNATGYDDKLFLRMFINYKNMTLSFSQLSKDIHSYFENELYFAVKLERNDSIIFECEFLGSPGDENRMLNDVHKFQFNDKLFIFHAEPERLFIDNESLQNINGKTTGWSGFVLTKKGLLNMANENLLFIKADMKRIDKFNTDYNIRLSYNSLYKFYLNHYIRIFKSDDMDGLIPGNWNEAN